MTKKSLQGWNKEDYRSAIEQERDSYIELTNEANSHLEEIGRLLFNLSAKRQNLFTKEEDGKTKYNKVAYDVFIVSLGLTDYMKSQGKALYETSTMGLTKDEYSLVSVPSVWKEASTVATGNHAKAKGSKKMLPKKERKANLKELIAKAESLADKDGEETKAKHFKEAKAALGYTKSSRTSSKGNKAERGCKAMIRNAKETNPMEARDSYLLSLEDEDLAAIEAFAANLALAREEAIAREEEAKEAKEEAAA